MTPTLSFMSANYVARTLGYAMHEGWMQGDAATNRHFQPAETFEARFEEVVRDIDTLGFRAMDVWTAHLNPAWATPAHLDAARRILATYQIEVVSLAGYFGDTADDVRASCRLAQALGASVLGGNTALLTTDRAGLVALLKEHHVRLGIENHPEKTPEDLLAKIGPDDDRFLGATVDTGWFGTQGYDAAQAIEVLGARVFHVHLKDVLPPEHGLPPGVTMKSMGHETCAFGDGIVPLEACVQTLHRLGYRGALSIEHEPELFDPTDDVRESLARLKQWL